MKEEKMKAKKNNIELLSLEDIIKKIGFFTNFGDLRATYKFNGKVADMREFEKKMNLEIRTNKRFEEYLKIIKEYEHIFDKNLYVFHVVRLLQETYDKIINPEFKEKTVKSPIFLYNGKSSSSINSTDELKKILRKARKMIIDTDLDIIEYEANSQSGEVKIYESREFTGKTQDIFKDDKKSQERLLKIDKEIGLEKIISFITPTDLIDICKYPNLGNFFAVRLIEHGKKINNDTNTIYQNKLNEKEYEVLSKTHKKANFFSWNEFINTVKENIRFIDIDKLLLLSNTIFYNRYQNDFEKFSEKEARELKEFTRKVETLLEDKNVSISSQRFNSEVDFNLIKSSVESLNKHYINGKYYDDIEINELVKDILSGKRNVTFLTEEEYRQTMAFNPAELIQIVTTRPETLIELDKRGWLTEKELTETIIGLEHINTDQLFYLFKNKKIDANTILEYYISNKISLESIKRLRNNAEDKKEVEQMVSAKKLVELFLDEEKKEELVKYRNLYQLLKFSGKSLDEQKELANEILEQSDDLLSEDKIQELYHMGLIPLDTYIDFIGTSAVSDLYSKGELKPTDARRLYDQRILTEDMIRDFLKNNEIDNGKKLVLIYSTFPNNEDLEIRKNLMKYVKISKKSIYNKGERTKETAEEVLESGKSSNRFFTDPCARWNLLASLDNEYSFEYKSDGSAICYLPNRGRYIIEKLHDKENEPAYGAATYILDEKTYLNNKNKIITDDVINRSELVKLNKSSSGVKKLIHTGWSNAICKYFDIEDTTKYTKEQIKQIKKFSKQVEDSKEILER